MTRPAAGARRRTRVVVWSAGLVTAGAVLAGCANADAQAQARQACTHVTKALSLFAAAQALSPGQAAPDLNASLAELRAALPIAAVAAGQSAHWQPLMTTLSESSRVPESYLVHALGAECADADNPGL
ncbi:MAG TPA: hypothetical protein VMU09_08345 [Acidimicrobiales bacterium]|nr:hypothetical protein [Acidimicrobiales bacterium]